MAAGAVPGKDGIAARPVSWLCNFETNRSMRPLKPLPIQACDVKPKLDENIDERLITSLRRAGHDAALLPESRHDPHPVP